MLYKILQENLPSLSIKTASKLSIIIAVTFNNKSCSAVIQTAISKRHTGKRGLRVLERIRRSEDPGPKEDHRGPKEDSIIEDPRDDHITEYQREDAITNDDLERTLSIRPQTGPFTNTILRISRESKKK